MSQCLKILRSLDEIIASLVLVFILLLTMTGVVFRYLLNQPLAWQEEISTVLMVWLVFMGCSLVAKKSTPIRIDTLTELLPRRQKRIWLCVVHVTVLVVLGVVLYYSALLTLQTQKQTSVLKIPYQCVYAAIPISVFLMMCTTMTDFIKTARPGRSAP